MCACRAADTDGDLTGIIPRIFEKVVEGLIPAIIVDQHPCRRTPCATGNPVLISEGGEIIAGHARVWLQPADNPAPVIPCYLRDFRPLGSQGTRMTNVNSDVISVT